MCEFLLEAEGFSQKGGWVVDQQSMETLHSAYLMAHGMGIPVADAMHRIEVLRSGTYHVWVLCRDWTAVWKVRDPAGKFKVAIDGKDLPEILGTNGPDWMWQKAGIVNLSAGFHEIRLRDLTGFNGRCDCLYFTESDQPPSSAPMDVEQLRRRLNWQRVEESEEVYDLIVVGGGVSGICIALSALRSGVKTLLIHDRGVLGGCNSSEVRVCMGGMANLDPYPQIGNVVKEIAPVMGHPFIFAGDYYEDHRKLAAFEASKMKHRVRLNQCVTEVECEGHRIVSVVCTHVLTGKKVRYRGTLFADCTGDGVLARKSGCAVMYGREPFSAFGESLAPAEAQRMVMGHSIRWYSEEGEEQTSFPELDWNLPFDDRTCLNVYNGDWEQETGFARDMVTEIEYIRDFGLRAIYSNWSYQKNQYCQKAAFVRHSLKWVSALGGKRESYRVVGDHILTQQDVEEHRPYPDATACMTWSIDIHFPEPDNAALYEEPFRSFAYHRGIGTPYAIPYRCLYARDVENLFLGGRLVSASHVAFSSLRVMRTLGQLGEVVGLAAAVCKEYGCYPRAVYSDHLDALKDRMTQGVPIPSAFHCGVGEEEKYHFKDIGWLHLYPEYDCDERHLEKFKRGIKALEIQHKYPLPDHLKD